MVRIFDEVDIAHVEGNIDPVRDIEIIHDELRCIYKTVIYCIINLIRLYRLKDLELAKKIADDIDKKFVRGTDKTLKADHVSLFYE